MTTKEIKIVVPTSRNKRAVNTSVIRVNRNNKSPTSNAIFHKSNSGHTLLELNEWNEAIQAWTDVTGIVPISSSLINSKNFTKKLKQIHPKTLYTNNGSMISPLDQYNVVVYTDDSTLVELLDKIKIAKKTVEVQQSIPSFSQMLALDKNMTKEEYTKFCVDCAKL